jgi:hypothetical protein
MSKTLSTRIHGACMSLSSRSVLSLLSTTEGRYRGTVTNLHEKTNVCYWLVNYYDDKYFFTLLNIHNVICTDADASLRPNKASENEKLMKRWLPYFPFEDHTPDM